MIAARRRLFAVALVAGLTTLVARDTGRAQPAGRDDVLVLKNVMVAMRDGVRLATDVYRPAKNGVPVTRSIREVPCRPSAGTCRPKAP